jgi:hypothetical protein
MKKQYVYIGQYYHIKNKELPLDYKFGVTDDLDQREYSLGRTKSPIKYMILKAWELPSNVKREKVEKMIALVFDEHKYDGCEWYDVDGETFQGKIKSLFEILSEMVDDTNFSFVEVDLNKSDETTDIVEKEIESEIRSGRKSPWTNISVEIDGINLSSDSGKVSFINSIKYIISKVGEVNLAIDFPNILKLDLNEYPEYKKCQSEKLDKFYLDTHSSTQEKIKILKSIVEKYNITSNISVNTNK